MIKIRKFCFFLTLIFFSSTQLYSQEPDFERVINDIEKGEIDKARILLMSLERDNPTSTSVKFLKALLSEDGAEAAKLYRDVAFAADDNELKDDALFKLFQYYYSRGEFSDADKYARMLQETFPKSEFVNYLKKQRHSPSSSQAQQKFEQKNLSDTSKQITPSQNIASQRTVKFAIQVGAFSKETNAQKLAAQLKGYSIKIREKEISGKKLYVVLVGDFENESDAKHEIKVLKNNFNIDGILIPLQ